MLDGGKNPFIVINIQMTSYHNYSVRKNTKFTKESHFKSGTVVVLSKSPCFAHHCELKLN